jgi:serine protease Do
MKRVLRHAGVFLAASAVSLCFIESYPSTQKTVAFTQFQGDSGFDEEVDDSESSNAVESGRSLLVQQGRSASSQGEYFGSRGSGKTDHRTLRAFKDCVGDTYKSTVQILVGGRQVALGAIVHSQGWIVTKSSEIPDECEVKLYDQGKAVGVTKLRRREQDLAIIKIERNDLVPVKINPQVEVPVGGWLVSSSFRQTPLNFGVLSVAKRTVQSERPVLGIRLGNAPAGSGGAIVESVVIGGGADRAGIQPGDVIVEVDGHVLPTRQSVLEQLKTVPAGHYANVTCVRDGRSMTFRSQMMDLPNSLFDSTEMEVNGEISSRATGFTNVMQHDTVLLPHQCGGPVVDLDGNFVGLNIARAGRVVSLAYGAKELQPLVFDMLRTVNADVSSLWDDSRVVKASATDDLASQVSTGAIPDSVPSYIQVEALKKEVVIPAKNN